MVSHRTPSLTSWISLPQNRCSSEDRKKFNKIDEIRGDKNSNLNTQLQANVRLGVLCWIQRRQL